MAAPPKYPREHKEALIALVLDDGLTIRAACQRIATGHDKLEPVTIPEYTAGDWVRDARREDRPNLASLELPDILNTTARGLFELVNADIYRMRHAKGMSDPDALLTLARTLKELQPLALHRPKGSKGQQQPDTTLGTLASVPEPSAAPTSPAVRTARSLHS